MSLAETILAVSLALSGPTASAERVQPIVDAIVAEAEAAPLWKGDDGAKRTALVMLSIAAHESGFLPTVRTCQRNGDGGLALGAFQAHRWARAGVDDATFCASDTAQAHAAWRVLALNRRRGVASETALLAAYATGSAGGVSKGARELTATLKRATRMAGRQ